MIVAAFTGLIEASLFKAMAASIENPAVEKYRYREANTHSPWIYLTISIAGERDIIIQRRKKTIVLLEEDFHIQKARPATNRNSTASSCETISEKEVGGWNG